MKRSLLRRKTIGGCMMILAVVLLFVLVQQGVCANIVWSCGQNDLAQLGLGIPPSSFNSKLVQITVPTPMLSDVVAISAGADHSLFLLTGGYVYACGMNSPLSWQLGSPTANPQQQLVPVLVPYIADATVISAGNAFSLVGTGTLGLIAPYSFGANSSGQLGQGTNSSPLTAGLCYPWSPSSPPVVAVAAGDDHGLVLLADGTVLACGQNNHGQLGLGAASMPVTGLKQVQLPSGSIAMKIAAGHAFSLVLLSTGDVYAFGVNDWGQLGLGPAFLNSDVATPTQIGFPTQVSEIAAGYRHSLVLDCKAAVWAFGNNEHGELGIGYRDQNPHPAPEIVQVPNSVSVKYVAAGYDDSFFWDLGSAHAFGDDTFGQLGLGSIAPGQDVCSPADIPIQGVLQIAAGWYHTLVLTLP